MEGQERTFAVTIAGVHGMDHLLKRVFPPLIPIWAVVFGFPLWQLGLLMGARTFGAAVGMTPMGHLSDRFDRRYLLPAGFGVMGLGTLVIAGVPVLLSAPMRFSVAGQSFTGQFGLIFLAMIAMGLGTSSVHPTGYPLITANVSTARKGTVLGMWGSASKFGDGAAPAIVGVLLLALAWHQILALFAVLAIGYSALLFVLLRDYETRPAGVETDEPRESAEIDRSYRLPLAAVFAYFVIVIASAGGVTVFIPEFINSTYGFSFSILGTELGSESTASFYFSALLVIAGVAQLGTGRLADRYDERFVILAYVGVAGLALIGLATLVLTPLSLFLLLVVLGTTLFGMNPARDALVSHLTPDEREGRVFGYIWTGALLGSAGAPVLVGYIGDIAGLRPAFLILAGGVLLSAVPIALLSTSWVPMPGPEPGGSRAD